jgi:hypothetical protein
MADFEQSARTAVERAALVGAFAPKEFLRAVWRQPDATAFDALGRHCEEVSSGPGVEWILKPDRRREVLVELKQAGRLQEVASVTSPAGGDSFGRFLSGAVRGEKWDMAALNRTELGAMHAAMHFAKEVVEVTAPTDAVQLALGRRDADNALELVLPTRLIGRERELQQLVEYATQPAVSRSIKPLFVTGVGGSGKSALLAEFTRHIRGAQWSGSPVITLDFDRPAVSSADGVEMLLEFSRQLGLHRPAYAAALSSFRELVRTAASYETRAGSSFEHDARLMSRVWSFWNEACGAHLPLKEPVVVILDTFEEVSVRGEEEVGHVMDWLSNLQYEGRISRLRPVFSGRAIPAAERGADSALHIELGDLEPTPSVELLQLLAGRAKLVLSDDLCGRIVKRTGGNPLMLRIVSDFLAQEGVEAAQELLRTGSGSMEKVLSQSYLYGRILKRIRTDDKDIVKIAHPGLALRRVTAALIEHVLAPTCDIKVEDGTRAETLFAKLTKQVWLVEPTTNPRVVRHRQHVRAQMMRSLSRSEASAIRKVHRAAERFYSEGRDAYLTSDESRLEAQYHSLFTGRPRPPSPADIKSFMAGVSQELESIPVKGRAVLKVAAGMALTEDEAAQLSGGELTSYTEQRVSSQLARGKVEDAARSLGGSARSGVRNPGSAFATHYAAGKLEEASRFAGPFLGEVLDEIRMQRNPRAWPQIGKSLVDSHIWHAAIVLPQADRRALGSEYFDVMRDAAIAAAPGGNFGFPIDTKALEMLSALIGRTPRKFTAAPDSYFTDLIEQFDELRYFQLLGRRRSALNIRGGLLQNLSRPYLALFSGLQRPGALRTHGVDDHTIEQCRLALSTGRPISSTAERSLAGPAVVERRFVAGPMRRWELDLIQGLMPELYPPLCGALRSVPRGALEDYARQMERLPTWPRDMAAQAFRLRLRKDRRRAEASLVAMIDRHGGLMHFAEYCAGFSARPDFDDFISIARRYAIALRARHGFSTLKEREAV